MTSRGNDISSLPQLGQLRPNGLGGWLFIAIVGLFIGVALYAFMIFGNIRMLISTLFDKSPPYPIWLTGLVVVSLAITLIMVYFAVHCLINIFRRDSRIPDLMVSYYLVSATATYFFFIVLLLFARYHPGNEIPDNIIGPEFALAAAGWIAYFQKSKRVKNTFVN